MKFYCVHFMSLEKKMKSLCHVHASVLLWISVRIDVFQLCNGDCARYQAMTSWQVEALGLGKRVYRFWIVICSCCKLCHVACSTCVLCMYVTWMPPWKLAVCAQDLFGISICLSGSGEAWCMPWCIATPRRLEYMWHVFECGCACVRAFVRFSSLKYGL